MGDRMLVGFRILDDANRVISEIWLDPQASRANICNFWPNGTVLESEDISLQEFIDVITALKDKHAYFKTEGPRGGPHGPDAPPAGEGSRGNGAGGTGQREVPG